MEKDQLLRRLKIIRGHIQGVERMIEEEKECDEILAQLVAIRQSVHKASALLFQDYSAACMTTDEASHRKLCRLLDILLKN